MSELKSPTKERVLAAAAKCDTARDVLKEMWPEAFEVECAFKVGDRVYVERAAWGVDVSGPGTIREVQNFSPEFFVSLGGGGCWWCHAKDLRPLPDEPWEDVTGEVRVQVRADGDGILVLEYPGWPTRTIAYAKFFPELLNPPAGWEHRVEKGRIERRRKK